MNLPFRIFDFNEHIKALEKAGALPIDDDEKRQEAGKEEFLSLADEWDTAARQFQNPKPSELKDALDWHKPRVLKASNEKEECQKRLKSVNAELERVRLVGGVVAEGVKQYGPTAKLRAVIPRNWRQKANMPKMAKRAKTGNYSEPIHWNLSETGTLEHLRIRPDSNWGYAGVDTKAGRLVDPFLGIVLSQAYCKAKGIKGGMHFHFLRTGFDVKKTWGETFAPIEREIAKLEKQEREALISLLRIKAKLYIRLDVLEIAEEKGQVPMIGGKAKAGESVEAEAEQEASYLERRNEWLKAEYKKGEPVSALAGVSFEGQATPGERQVRRIVRGK